MDNLRTNVENPWNSVENSGVSWRVVHRVMPTYPQGDLFLCDAYHKAHAPNTETNSCQINKMSVGRGKIPLSTNERTTYVSKNLLYRNSP